VKHAGDQALAHPDLDEDRAVRLDEGEDSGHAGMEEVFDENGLAYFQVERLREDSRALTGHSSKVELAFDGESLVTLGLEVVRHTRAFGVVSGLDEAPDKGASRGLDFPVDDHGLASLVRKHHLPDLGANLEFALLTEGCQLLQ
jgi:hypothetical protein